MHSRFYRSWVTNCRLNYKVWWPKTNFQSHTWSHLSMTRERFGPDTWKSYILCRMVSHATNLTGQFGSRSVRKWGLWMMVYAKWAAACRGPDRLYPHLRRALGPPWWLPCTCLRHLNEDLKRRTMEHRKLAGQGQLTQLRTLQIPSVQCFGLFWHAAGVGQKHR